jgi:hypothetical protein
MRWKASTSETSLGSWHNWKIWVREHISHPLAAGLQFVPGVSLTSLSTTHSEFPLGFGGLRWSCFKWLITGSMAARLRCSVLKYFFFESRCFLRPDLVGIALRFTSLILSEYSGKWYPRSAARFFGTCPVADSHPQTADS